MAMWNNIDSKLQDKIKNFSKELYSELLKENFTEEEIYTCFYKNINIGIYLAELEYNML